LTAIPSASANPSGAERDADHLRLRTRRSEGEGDSRCEASASDRNDHGLRLRHLLGELEADRPLAGDNRLVLERMDKGRPGLVDEALHLGERLLDRLADHAHVGAVALRRLDLRHRRVLRDEDRGVQAGLARGPGDRLRVVPRARGHDAGLPLGLAEHGELVDGAADLERAGALEILRLEVHLASDEAGEGLGPNHRRQSGDTGEPLAGLIDLSERPHRRRRRSRTPWT
jgi:hypothetical protein